jgi:serine/threonine-protein kinase RsbW
MKLRLRLSLPSEERSVPLVRKVMRHALDVMGVAPGCVDDIELALSEACTNVLDHAGAHDHYEVVAGVEGDFCVVEIFDAGGGFVPPALADQGVLIDPNAEQGRGLQLMRALVDKLDFRVCTDRGAVVRLQKSLVYAS